MKKFHANYRPKQFNQRSRQQYLVIFANQWTMFPVSVHLRTFLLILTT